VRSTPGFKGLPETKALAYMTSLSVKKKKFIYYIGTCGLYYKTIMIIIMTIVVTLQIVASLTIIIDDIRLRSTLAKARVVNYGFYSTGHCH
jgi:hypothetical protein